MGSDQSNTDTKISIIVPIYDTYFYLEECVNSVLNQTFPFFELLLINDGSTDKSKELCEELSGRDTRIELISYEEKKGTSYARNRGMDVATGKYLFFLDSDDIIHPQLLEKMYQQAEAVQADMVMTRLIHGACMSLSQWWSFCRRPYITKWDVLSGEEIMNHWFHLQEKNPIGGKLFLRDAVCMIRFDEGINHFEDSLFNYMFVSERPRIISYSDYFGYYYRYRKDSTHLLATFSDHMSSLEIKKRIRDAELMSGRRENAILVEQEYIRLIRKMISETKSISKQKHKKKKAQKRMTIIMKLYEDEKNGELFSQIPFYQRVILFFCINLYPLYKVLHSIKLRMSRLSLRLFYTCHLGRKGCI